MLNIPLIRRVQESIANTKNPFDMTHWETCICGHLKHVVTNQPIRPWYEPQGQFWALPEAVECLGVPMPWAIETMTYGAAYINTREKAISVLEQLIEADAAQTVPVPVSWAVQEREPELACV